MARSGLCRAEVLCTQSWQTQGVDPDIIRHGRIPAQRELDGTDVGEARYLDGHGHFLRRDSAGGSDPQAQRGQDRHDEAALDQVYAATSRPSVILDCYGNDGGAGGIEPGRQIQCARRIRAAVGHRWSWDQTWITGAGDDGEFLRILARTRPNPGQVDDMKRLIVVEDEVGNRIKGRGIVDRIDRQGEAPTGRGPLVV